MKYLFEVEDFEDLYSGVNISQDYATNKLNIAVCAANKANQKHNALIEQAPLVYGKIGDDGSFFNFTSIERTVKTHSARLMFLEEININRCTHGSVLNVFWNKSGSEAKINAKCSYCHVDLEPNWKEIK